MQFRLNYTPPEFEFKIDHSHQIMLAGSCFAENIGGLLLKNKFNVITNASGILFNPVSVLNCLSRATGRNKLDESEIIQRNGTYYSFQHHSSVNEESAEALHEKIKQVDKDTGTYLQTANFLIVTFGTAYIYKHLKNGTVAANCHKQPGSTFHKELLSVESICSQYSSIIEELQRTNPLLKIIFTVSPVKYLRDGVHENNLSKSSLLLAVNKLVTEHRGCYYFPAYELVNDDLRDYRFYNEDLAHPSPQAIQYVWEKFGAAAFSEKTRQIVTILQKLQKAREHRPLQAKEADPDVQKFIASQKEAILKLEPSFRF